MKSRRRKSPPPPLPQDACVFSECGGGLQATPHRERVFLDRADGGCFWITDIVTLESAKVGDGHWGLMFGDNGRAAVVRPSTEAHAGDFRLVEDVLNLEVFSDSAGVQYVGPWGSEDRP